MTCTETRGLLSPYLDGAITGKQMAEVRDHLSGCDECNVRYLMLGRTHRMVASLGRKQPPAELALRLRVALSREAAAAKRPWYTGLVTRIEDAINGFAVPATAGALSAVIVFGLLIGVFAPISLQARDNDVPTSFYTPPELRTAPSEAAYGPFSIGLSSIETDSIIIEAYVDANGRVQDYKILSAPDDLKAALPQLSNMLIFSQFRPATSFGRPISSKAVISFSQVNVKG